MPRAVIFANGQIQDIESVRSLLQPDDFLIAADGGTHHILLLGMMPSVVIGDLDSLGEIERKRVEAGGCKLIRHPRDKNETDFELALRYALELKYPQILVIGALGGRLDQTLGNLSVLSGDEFAGVSINFDDGLEKGTFLRQALVIHGNPGETVSLVPWGGNVDGITTDGLRWPLQNETLFADKTRGISNELIGLKGSVSIRSGLLLVIQRRKNPPI